jgi:gamma-glutamylcysteine synthetase
MPSSLDGAVRELASGFAERFPDRAPAPATVGREAELLLVDADGRAGDCARLWPRLLEAGGRPAYDESGLLVGLHTERWFCLAEVGRGTIEIGVGPGMSLLELSGALGEALETIVPAADSIGCRVLGFGTQPRTPLGRSLLTPKARYEALVRAVGVGWLRWTVTASDQVHVAVNRHQIVPAMNAINACSGAIIALTANSSVLGGRSGANASGREALCALVSGEPMRCGAVPRRFADLEDYVRWTIGFRALVLPDGVGGFRLPGMPYAELIRGRDPDLEEWLFHEHYIWPSARPRARLGTLEVRPACQQPGASFAAAALSVGLVAAADAVGAYVEDRFRGRAGWQRLLSYRRRAVRAGLAGREPAHGFFATLIDLAETGLRDRGLGEERLLDEVRARLERRRGPADEARDVFTRGGVPALVDARALRTYPDAKE